MPRFRVCDLETAPHPDAPQWVDPVKADARLKDPAKIAANLAEKTAERDERLGLDIDCNRIVALGYVDVGCGDPIVHLAKDEFEEREGLKQFWYSYNRYEATVLVTFNGFKFDLPVLMRRSLYLSVPCPVLNLDRYRSNHLDLWNRLSFNGAIPAHSLKFYAKRFGFDLLDKIDGADIAGLVAENTVESWQKVHDHCLSDLGLTHALANRMGLLTITTVLTDRDLPSAADVRGILTRSVKEAF